MKKFLISFILVILNPYEEINYDEINTYVIDEKCEDDCVGYTQSDFLDRLQSIEQQFEEFNQDSDLFPAHQER